MQWHQGRAYPAGTRQSCAGAWYFCGHIESLPCAGSLPGLTALLHRHEEMRCVLRYHSPKNVLEHLLSTPWLQLDVGGSRQLVGPGPSEPSIGETKAGGQVLRAGHKRFFFDLGSNQKGDFLRITEASCRRTSRLRPFATRLPNSAHLITCLPGSLSHMSHSGCWQRADVDHHPRSSTAAVQPCCPRMHPSAAGNCFYRIARITASLEP